MTCIESEIGYIDWYITIKTTTGRCYIYFVTRMIKIELEKKFLMTPFVYFVNDIIPLTSLKKHFMIFLITRKL